MQVTPNSKTIIVGTGVISDASWKYEVNQQSAEMGGRLFQDTYERKENRCVFNLLLNVWSVLVFRIWHIYTIKSVTRAILDWN